VNRKFFFYLFLFFLIPLIFIQFRGLWAPDEARYARVASEMKASESLLVPRLNGDLYAEKPPLFFDLAIAASVFSKGVPEYGVKIVSLFSALLVIVLLTLIGIKFGLKESCLPVIVLLGMPRFIWQAQFGQIDMLLCALVYLQLWFGLSILLDDKTDLLKAALLGFSSFLAIVSKGPAGVIPTFIVLTAFAFFIKHQKKLGNIFGSLLVALSFVSIWLVVAGMQAGWDYPKSLLFKQTVTRYLDPWHHYAPWYYYLTVLWGDGFPVVLFIIPAIILIIKKKEWKEQKWGFPIIVILAYLLFFSVSSAKRSVYILPIYPAIALLISFAVEKWSEKAWDNKGLKIISAILTSIFGIALALAIFTNKIPADYKPLSIYLEIGLLIFWIFSLISFILISRKDIFRPQLFAFASCLFMLVSALPIVKAIDPVKAPYALAQAMKPKIAGGRKLGVSGSLVPSVNYYLDTNTKVFKEKEEDIAAKFLDEGNYLLIERETLEKSLFKNYPPAWQGRIGGTEYLVITAK
jgi:4-amino-4-deoxy-L-arabinose transferase-like glycosyltransferase